MKYRADIDGLRAIAVLSVILYHLNPQILHSGFVGVDIFFVISGYVITSSVLNSINTFSWIDFYCRRIKRILPSMFLVLTTIILLSMLLYVNDLDIFYVTDATKAAAAYVYNIYLMFHNTGYFELPTQTQPVLHMWSLSVEEQFYILFPLLCYFGFKKSYRFTKYWLVIFFILSLIISQIAIEKHFFNFAYYSLPSRAYELLAGVIVASYSFKFAYRYAVIFSMLGLIFLIVATIFIPQEYFPGFWGLIPVLGASLVIIGGYRTNIVNSLLSIRILAFVGKISYVLYLWHWVVISFYKYEVVIYNPTIINMSAMLAITFILAIFTHYYVEMPLRYKTNLSSKQIVLNYQIYPLGLFLIIATAITIMTKTCGIAKHTMSHQMWKENIFPHGFCHGGDIVGDCTFGSKSKTSSRIAIYGDSHAVAIAPFLEEFAKGNDLRVYMRSNGGCMPLIVNDNFIKEPWNNEAMKQWCYRQNIQMVKDLDRFDTIVLVVYWPLNLSMTVGKFDLLKEMHNTLDYFVAHHKRVILFGDTPVYDNGDIQMVTRREKLMQYLPFLPKAKANFVSNNSNTDIVLQNLAKEYKGKNVYFFDTKLEIVNHIKTYPYINGYLIYSDNNHLNPDGAKILFDYTFLNNRNSLSRLYMLLSPSKMQKN